MTLLPKWFTGVLEGFAPVFSARIWPQVQLLVVGALLSPRKLTVTAALRVLGLADDLRFGTFHRLLSRAHWSSLRTSRVLLGLLLTAFVPSGPLVLGLDDTSIVADVAPSTMKPFLGLVRKMLLTPEEGARTAIYLATSPSVEGVTGKYFIKEAQVRSPEASYDVKFQEQLWQASAALVGLNCAPVPG